ncbi:MAG: hypothetical protein WA947_04305, partial [Phormidesmis sp.]
MESVYPTLMRILAAVGRKRIVFITIAILIYLASISFSVVAQTTSDGPSFKVGIRTIVPPVKSFCDAFQETLQQKINLAPGYESATVSKVAILNEYRGKFYYRYAGLLNNNFDIAVECGPNSISSGNLERLGSGSP